MKRGDVVVAAAQGDYGKPRPYLVVQADLFNSSHPSVTMLPFSTRLLPAPLYRLTVDPSVSNGLSVICQIMVDKIDTLAVDKVSKVVGQLEDDTMTRVNRAMAVWLGIAS